MSYMRGRRLIGAVLILSACMLTGCGASQNAKFYALSSLATQETSGIIEAKDAVIIAVGPIRIPEYLDRPQIVTRSGQNELLLSEYQRWGGSLEDELKRVMSENVRMFLGERYSVVNWPVAAEGNSSIRYRVGIDILQFEGIAGNAVALKSQWGVIATGEKQRMAVRTSAILEPIAGQDHEATVAAMSRALAKLCREIADVVRSLPTAQKQ